MHGSAASTVEARRGGSVALEQRRVLISIVPQVVRGKRRKLHLLGQPSTSVGRRATGAGLAKTFGVERRNLCLLGVIGLACLGGCAENPRPASGPPATAVRSPQPQTGPLQPADSPPTAGAPLATPAPVPAAPQISPDPNGPRFEESGPLSDAQRAVFRAVGACLEAAFAQGGVSQSGPATIQLFVEPSGRVTGTSVSSKPTYSASTRQCIDERLRQIQLDVEPGGGLRVLQYTIHSTVTEQPETPSLATG